MKISYNWLKEYLPLDLPADDLAGVLTSLGLEVSSVERFSSIRGGLRGVVAGKVLTCEKHPNADRLRLTTVDIDNNTVLHIVCGAPNVAAGQTVWVATIGTVLYPSGRQEPLSIAKAKVRGEVSEGMICAADELGLGEDHSGIVVLPGHVAAGTAASAYYNVTEDDVIEIELTPNRSDATSHLGVARDLAAWFAVNGNGPTLRLPQIPEISSQISAQPVAGEVRNSEACPRYCGITISGVTVRESPLWLQDRLRAIDVRPVNNIVDITNFVLHEMGQPLHAFDADRISTHRVVIQTLPEGTRFVTLDGVERTLAAQDLMICDGDDTGICIAGVYGGIGTGITEASSNLFLESAHFHPKWIRRTSMRHDLRTDAARTFEKTTDPNICRSALLRAAALIVEHAGGAITSAVIDIYPVPVEPAHVLVRRKMIDRLTGVAISDAQIQDILAALNMEIVAQDESIITVSVPTDKADVTREADVIEEILRIYGFDNVPMHSRMEIALTTETALSMHVLRDKLSTLLTAQGCLEMMSMSLIPSREYSDGPMGIPENERVLIDNTSNISLDLMRHTLLASALDAVRYNQNRMQNDLMLFEFGKTYRKDGVSIREEEHLTLTLTGQPIRRGWRGSETSSDFFGLKKYVRLVLDTLGIDGLRGITLRDKPWEYALTYQKDDRHIVTLGKMHRLIEKQYDLRTPVYIADFHMEAVLACIPQRGLQVNEPAKFPAVHRDIAIVIDKGIPYAQVEETILTVGGALLTEHFLFDIYENAEALGTGKHSLAIALEFRDPGRTLTDAAVNSAVQQIVDALYKQTGAVLR
jgi:phenylalanyl-tRNA synthetase beta chain